MPERSRFWLVWSLMVVLCLVNGWNVAQSLRLAALVREASARAEASRASAARARAELPPPPAILFAPPRARPARAGRTQPSAVGEFTGPSAP